MTYQRGFSSLGCPELSLDETLALAREHQIPCVELRVLAEQLDLPEYFAKAFGTPERLAAHLRTAGVRVVALDTSFRLVGAAPADREALRQFIPWAEAAGVRWLRAFDGGKTADEAELAEAEATMAWWRGSRRANGWSVDLMVETHDSLFTAGAIGRFLARVPDAWMLWDTHHTWKRGGEDPLVTWRAIKSRVAHVHVKDSVSRASGRHAFTYVMPGAGEFPMAPLRAVLAQEFAGVVSLEWERKWLPELAPLDEVLRTAAERGWW